MEARGLPAPYWGQRKDDARLNFSLQQKGRIWTVGIASNLLFTVMVDVNPVVPL